ncbi:MAG: molybdopterin converting factor large subunit [Chitinophagaceae bacterium]|nr:MAG: molybdopterin converting factor large [Chitinophagaceae bacterium]TXT29992.1 MAG: molybdopterin converting factor large subunit [Chitinophagaceae bacterium]
MNLIKGKKTPSLFVQGPIPAQKVADDLQKHSTKTAIGAHSIFLGQVRADQHENGLVQAIEYTAYEEMALSKMEEIREGLFAKYELSCMHVYHSLGTVAVGEICLFVFVSSKHRKNAIDACEELVEQIKKDLPIWGKEIYTNTETTWKVNQ